MQIDVYVLCHSAQVNKKEMKFTNGCGYSREARHDLDLGSENLVSAEQLEFSSATHLDPKVQSGGQKSSVLVKRSP